MTRDELNYRLTPLMEQIEALDATMPLAVYAPASVARQQAERDALMRRACGFMDIFFGVTR
jgi:hypothetical protein